MEQRKKQRVEKSTAWTDASILIAEKGGFISPFLKFCHSSRTVKTTQHIQKNSLLMRLQSDSLISLKRVENSSVGTSLFQMIDQIEDSKLFHDKKDLVLSLFLAFVAEENKTNEVTRIDSYNDVLIYLSTLPDNASYNNLPRRWTDNKLVSLLGGTSVRVRVREEKRGFENDYKITKEKYTDMMASNKSKNGNIFNTFPSIELFDQMLAAVGSRAFDSLGEDEVDVMVPLLDLLNHKRGVGETSDVSYTKQEKDGSILVTAKCDLEAGTSPGITYGAKGNSQLLTRYGFTMRNNLEKDMSSNDEMEIRINGKLCRLRTGPKSYTYGCFVKALECAGTGIEQEGENANVGQQQGDDGHDVPDDMEDFLNSCEEEDEFDVYGEVGEVGEGEEECEDTRESDCKALESLQKTLSNVTFELRGQSLAKALEDPNDRFCAYLVNSEMRTIRFYIQAADLVLKRFKGGDALKDNAPIDDCSIDTDCKLLKKQAVELCDAFFNIRYPES